MKKIKYAILGLLVAAVSAGCTSNFEKTNTDPNRMPFGSILPDGLIESTIFKGAEGMLDRTFSINGELIQFTVSGTTNNSYHRYYISSGLVSGVWDLYAKWAVNSNEMYNLAVKYEEVNMQAIALTLRTMYVSNLTDSFGDIPFSQAFTIYTDNPITKPEFDTQKDVYMQLYNDLELANSLYAVNADFDITTKDLLYGGDLVKWQKFTNSLYLRLLMRLSNRADEVTIGEAAATIPQKIQEIVANPTKYPIFESLDDAAVLYYTGVAPFQNKFGGDNDMNSRRAAEYMINYMWNNRDPRISIYYRQSGNEWNGQKSGMTSQETDNENVAYMNEAVLKTYTSPYSFMRHDEVLFILAEAAQRGWITGGDAAAEEYYKQAIAQSIWYWNMASNGNIRENTISQFIANVPYDGTLKSIMEQKHVALFWSGFDAWYEYRRTEYPELPIGTGTYNDHILPRRFEYPVNTRSTNEVNYNKVVARMAATYVGGGDNMRTPVWWAKAAIDNARP